MLCLIIYIMTVVSRLSRFREITCLFYPLNAAALTLGYMAATLRDLFNRSRYKEHCIEHRRKLFIHIGIGYRRASR
jgi:hypothetical protein